MGEDAVAERGVWQVAHHGYLDHRHDLAPFDPEDGAAQDLTGLAVDHGLHHSPALVHLQRPWHVAHRDAGNPDVTTLLTGLRLAQAHPPELRVYKDRVGHQAVGCRRVFAVEQV